MLTSLFSLLPSYLLFLILIFIIFPTVLGVFLRLSLYGKLRDLEKQVHKLVRDRASTGIIDKIRQRFRDASEKVEAVNTTAIIDRVFRQERIQILGISVPWEVADRFCRLLPNLLLTLGLIGTFVGITINLSNISTTLNQVDGTDIQNLIDELQQPLQGMGIAFISSLVALGCSVILILTNSYRNTTALKLKILSTLEDYLDNVYLPEIPSHSRLDRAVDRMVSQQQEFLTRFHDNVTEAVEASLGKVADKIAEGNQESTDLAKQVYERFTETAGTLSHGATQFQYAIESLEQEVVKIQQVGDKLTQGATIFETAAGKIEESQFAENLDRLTASLAETQTAFADSTAKLQTNIEDLTNSNLHAADLAEQLSSNLNTFTDSLQQSAGQFEGVANTIKNSQFDLTLLEASENLQTTQTQFTETITNFEKGIDHLGSAIAQTENTTQQLNQVSEQLGQLNQKSQELAKLNQDKLNQIRQSLYLLLKAISDHNFIKKTVSGLDTLQQQNQKIIQSHQNTEQNQQSTQEILASLQYNLMKLLTIISDSNHQDKTLSSVEEIRNVATQLNIQLGEVKEASNTSESLKQKTLCEIQSELSQFISRIDQQQVLEKTVSGLNVLQEQTQQLNQQSQQILENQINTNQSIKQ
ncbi:hypothetical protein PCC7418_3845 [Halothece sp. PCC 7418]|uniref:hypothetical protein n=1 Tax=Halothece sp. (strain PCC 7418) TaxID=65093 RepID=UPI0002A0601B|nr:hypothetical protein [Halothece sp. PCC 7418]AFZ45949.1 hypothetical protein PCC7418_3845 [Halothece sp. PCC 7418]